MQVGGPGEKEGWEGKKSDSCPTQRGSMFARDTQMQRMRFSSLVRRVLPMFTHDLTC